MNKQLPFKIEQTNHCHDNLSKHLYYKHHVQQTKDSIILIKSRMKSINLGIQKVVDAVGTIAAMATDAVITVTQATIVTTRVTARLTHVGVRLNPQRRPVFKLMSKRTEL